eukprot:Lankesteria_metandrocarpae@DN5077_c0_g1_i13.p1
MPNMKVSTMDTHTAKTIDTYDTATGHTKHTTAARLTATTAVDQTLNSNLRKNCECPINFSVLRSDVISDKCITINAAIPVGTKLCGSSGGWRSCKIDSALQFRVCEVGGGVVCFTAQHNVVRDHSCLLSPYSLLHIPGKLWRLLFGTGGIEAITDKVLTITFVLVAIGTVLLFCTQLLSVIVNFLSVGRFSYTEMYCCTEYTAIQNILP